MNKKSVVTQAKTIAKAIIGIGLLLVLIFSIADFRGSPTILPDLNDTHLKAYTRGSLTDAQATVFSSSCGQEISISEAGSLDDYGSMNNPAAAYCGQLGHKYEIVTSSDGGQYGICQLPDDVTCDAWGFLTGKCGQDYSVCAQQGLQTVTLDDGQNPYSIEYAVCADADGNHVSSATDMIELYQAPESDTPQGHNPLSKSGGPLETDAYIALPDAIPPASFDWRIGGWMSPVKDQGVCGSCWSFSAVGVTEAVHNISSSSPGLDLDLSEQYLVSDCLSQGNGQTCCGGWKDEALKYIRDYGVPDDDCMTYVDGDFTSGCGCDGGSCGTPASCTYNSSSTCSDRKCTDRCANWADRLTKINSTGYVSPDPTSIKQALIAYGPLAVSYGYGPAFGGSFDVNGIYRCTDDSSTNHAVVMVGYNDAGGYWIIKNSWGTSYPTPADGGYFKMGYGECSIEQKVYYADVAAIGSHKIYLPLVLKNYSSSPPNSPIPNGDFELGRGVHWQEYSSNGYELVLDSSRLIVTPRSGNWAAWLGGDDNETSRIYQQVTVPSSNHLLSFWYQIGSKDTCGHDYAYVKINNTGSWPMELCTTTETPDWTHGVIDLAAYAGQSVTLEFRVETDSSLNSNLFIDDVSFAASALLQNEPAMPQSALGAASALSASKQEIWEPR